MDNPRAEKVAVVDEVRTRLAEADATLLTEYRGLDVGDLAELRRSLREAGGDLKIYKNTLARLAAADLGLDGLDPLLVGPTAFAFVDGDAAAVAKTLRDFSKANPALVLKGGVLGDRTISVADTEALANLPARDVLLARLAGGLAAPLQQLAGLLAALPQNFAYALKALIDQQGGAPEAVEPIAEPAEASAEPADEPADADADADADVPADAEATAVAELPVAETESPVEGDPAPASDPNDAEEA